MSRLRTYLDLLKNPLPAVALVLLAAVLPYLQTLHYPFMLDDPASIHDNPLIQDLGRFLDGTGFRYNPRRFIGYLTLALNYRFGGLDTVGYHAVNIFIHAAAALLVYALVRITFRTPRLRESFLAPRGAMIALAAALLFAVHPIQTQAVTYIIQRFASLSALFYLLTLVLYGWGRLRVGGRKTEDGGQRTEGKDHSPSVSRDPLSEKADVSPLTSHGSRFTAFLLFAGAAISALLAMLTKEIAVTLPLAVLLFEVSFFRPSRRRKLLLAGGLAVAVALPLTLLAVTDRPLDEVLGEIDRRLRESRDISRHDYLLTQFRVVVTYLRLLFFPVNQNLDYNHPVYYGLFNPPVFFSFLLLLGLTALAGWLYWRTGNRERGLGTGEQGTGTGEQGTGNGERGLGTGERGAGLTDPGSRIPGPEYADPGPQSPVPDPSLRLIGFGILWFFLTLSVESSLIPIADVLVEHRLYLPSVGIALAVAVAAALLGRKVAPRWLVAVLVVVVATLGIATVRRNQVWSDPVTLWSDVARKSPLNERAWCNLGVALLERGDVEEGIEKLVTSARINPGYAKTQLNLGVAFGQQGRLPEAAQALEAALAINPKLWLAHANLGTICWRMGRLDLAIEHLEAALKLNPRDTVARSQLDQFLRLKKQFSPPESPAPEGR